MQAFAQSQKGSAHAATPTLAHRKTATSSLDFGERRLPLPPGRAGNQSLLRSLRADRAQLGNGGRAMPERSGNNLSSAPPPAARAELTINRPGDEFEQEADLISEQVTHMAAPDTSLPVKRSAGVGVQRTCACGGACSSCQNEDPGHEHLHRKPTAPESPALSTAPPIVHQVLTSPGQPLDAATRAFMEPRFGFDLSSVRIHTDPSASASAEAIDAAAYTVERHVAFGRNKYSPGTAAGRTLLAHELAHVVQQSRGAASIQRAPADTSTASKEVTQAEKDELTRSMREALGVPLTPDDIWRELLQRRAGPLSSPASRIAAAPDVAGQPGLLSMMATQIEDLTQRLKKARGKNREILAEELKNLRKSRSQLQRGVELGAFGEGRRAGTNQITYAGIQVEDAAGRRLTIQFAETRTGQHAEEEIVATLRQNIATGRLREADLVGGRLLVVGDQFVCPHVGRCRTALSEFARDYRMRSVESSVFQRDSFALGQAGTLISPRRTLTSATESANQPAPLTRTDETLYFDGSHGSGGSGPHSSAPQLVEDVPATASTIGHTVDPAAPRPSPAAAEDAARGAARAVDSTAEGGAKSGVVQDLLRGAEKGGLGRTLLHAGPRFVEGAVVGYVTNKVATHVLHGNKFEQEQAALDAANHVGDYSGIPGLIPPEPKEDTADVILGFVPPGWDIALAATGRFLADRLYDAVQETRETRVKRFADQNGLEPGSEEFARAWDDVQDLQEKWDTGLIDDEARR